MKHLSYAIDQVAEVVGGELVKGKANHELQHIVFDSRKIAFPKRSIFFAIKSARHDGHSYINELFEKGVRNFVVTDVPSDLAGGEASFIQVADAVHALQLLAKYHRQQFNIPVIGITGSNGKTIVKEWLNQLLAKDHTIVRSPKSYNSQIGTPLSVWQMTNEHTLGIFEAGISQPGEMENLREVIQPSIGIITNIGHAHDEGFLNVRQKVSEKLNLFTRCNVLIFCKDYHDINESILGIRERQQDSEMKLFSWSKSSEADLRITDINKKQTNSELEAQYLGKKISITIPFSDDASIENAIQCWATLLYLGMDNPKIDKRMKRLSRVAMRLELKSGNNDSSIINDSYNSDLESLKIALDFLSHQRQHEMKALVLSDILETGMPESDLYDDVVRLLKERKVDKLVGIGEALGRQKSKFEKLDSTDTVFYPDTDTFLQDYNMETFQGTTVLLKGARSFRFERISRILEEKVHETVLEINLDALAHNLNTYQSLLKPSTKIMAMVKAFGYGSGGSEIASLLEFYRTDYLAVAYVDEGIELRKAGITTPIMVMSPEQNSFEKMVSHKLEPEIYSLDIYRAFEDVLQDYSGTSIMPYPIHVKVDTGMHRLGFNEDEVQKLASLIALNPLTKVSSVFTHLAASEEKKHDKFTKEQFKQLEEMAALLPSKVDERPLLHVLNSAGIVRFPENQYDMVRLGLGLYGVDSTGEVQDKLRQVGSLRTRIAQVKTIAPKETVGYGRSYKANSERTIATVNIGYADGYDRRLGNGVGYMLVKGKKAPTVGQICMDMTMLDVTAIPGLRRGEEVTVFGEDLPVQDVATLTGTIAYEVLTGISKRVKRVYYQE